VKLSKFEVYVAIYASLVVTKPYHLPPPPPPNLNNLGSLKATTKILLLIFISPDTAGIKWKCKVASYSVTPGGWETSADYISFSSLASAQICILFKIVQALLELLFRLQTFPYGRFC